MNTKNKLVAHGSPESVTKTGDILVGSPATESNTHKN
jgi:hypothetical protein